MTGHIRSPNQRARLYEFITSESGAMNAKKAAQVGFVLGVSILASLVLSQQAKADCDPSCHVCSQDDNCRAEFGGIYCRTRWCGQFCLCQQACTWATNNYC